jgi:Leucine-rich repeat (LRR) protein
MVSLTDGNLTSLPIEIKYAKKLMLVNLTGNKLKTIPDEIAELDKSNGGRLNVLIVKEEEIGEENIKRLRQLLPNASIGE